MTKIKGNHIIQFGGTYQRNFDYHERNDNGQGINTSPVYQIGSGTGIQITPRRTSRRIFPAVRCSTWTNTIPKFWVS